MCARAARTGPGRRQKSIDEKGRGPESKGERNRACVIGVGLRDDVKERRENLRPKRRASGEVRA